MASNGPRRRRLTRETVSYVASSLEGPSRMAVVLAETGAGRAEADVGTAETAIDLAETGASRGRKRPAASQTALVISAVGSSLATTPVSRGSRSSGGRQAKPVVEKRLTRFLSKPSRAVLDRIERAYVHRLYLIGFDWPRAPRAAGGAGGGASGGTVAPGAGTGGGAGDSASLALALPPPRTPLPHNQPPRLSQSPSSRSSPFSQNTEISTRGGMSSPRSPATGLPAGALALAAPPTSALPAPHTPSSAPPATSSPLRPCSCNFHVLGATGNVYTVTISQQPSCTCPDSGNGNLCKHILFVLLRVLRVDQDDPRVWQRSLLSTELNELLDRIDDLERSTAAAASVVDEDGEDVLASRSVREQFARVAGGALSSDGSGPNSAAGSQDAVGESDQKPKQRPIEGDCPICYEPLRGAAAGGRGGKPAEAVVFCQRCGNNVHSDCFSRWKAAKRGGLVTCVWCRAPWEDESTRNTARRSHVVDYDSDDDEEEEGPQEYVNLSQYSDAHRHADTSLDSLYPDTHMFFGGGRRRGRSWW